MKEGERSIAVPENKVEKDYYFDEKALLSKQKKLKLILEKCIADKTVM